MNSKLPHLKKGVFLLLAPFVLSCGGLKFTASELKIPPHFEGKKAALNDSQKKHWHLLDLAKDSIPGMSVERAYKELIKDNKGEKVIVAVIDSGVDIDHRELNESIWVNSGEIPNNGIDDDNNGYIDDIHGWNFLGKITKENMEVVRLQKKEKPESNAFKKLDEARKESLLKKERELVEINYMVDKAKVTDSILSIALNKKNYSLEEAEEISPKTFSIMEAIIFKRFLTERNLTLSKLKKYAEGTKIGIEAHYNIDFDGRSLLGDNPEDIDDRGYGDPKVMGPDKKDADHGTHVAGIIAAKRDDNSGSKGIAKNIEIMVLRAVPDGDEYDKDVALAIRYAVDNGARIINTSFGKGQSPHVEWVWDALKHAEKKDVLVINAAGNSGKNVDPGYDKSFITDEKEGVEIVSNFITVGASSSSYGEDQIASFSNYGKKNVDVFAPGNAIWSSVPNDRFDYYDGTSMAAPNVSGVAAVLRSYFPKISAPQIKQILIKSGLPIYSQILDPEEGGLISPSKISRSGKVVNLYNALIFASNKLYKK